MAENNEQFNSQKDELYHGGRKNVSETFKVSTQKAMLRLIQSSGYSFDLEDYQHATDADLDKKEDQIGYILQLRP